jgi:hypothetical protein
MLCIICRKVWTAHKSKLCIKCQFRHGDPS